MQCTLLLLSGLQMNLPSELQSAPVELKLPCWVMKGSLTGNQRLTKAELSSLFLVFQQINLSPDGPGFLSL